MSTKIYNGYRLPWMELSELHEFMQRFRSQARQMAHESFLRILVEKATRQFDLRHRDDGMGSDRPLPSAKLLICEDQSESYASTMDFECSVTIIPLVEEKMLLAMIFCERQEYSELWESQEEVDEFGFWTNTDDYPDGVTREDWEVRESLWEKALDLDGSWRGSWHGMNFHVNDATHYRRYEWPDEDDVAEYLPTFEERIAEHTKELVEDCYHAANDFHYESGNFVEYMRNMKAWIESDEGQKVWSEYEEELRGKLQKEITLSDLKGKDADSYRW